MIELNLERPPCLSGRRSRLELYIDVLKIIKSSTNKPTRIMFAANVSWRTLKEVLADLEEKGLIEKRVVRGRKLFFITEEGKRILNAFETLTIAFAKQSLVFAQQIKNK